MKLPDDFRDLLVCLTDENVEFLVVGGFAVAYHGHVRATKDIDVFVRPTRENAARVIRALIAFGAPVQALAIGEDDFASGGKVVQLGVPPLRIDLLTGLSGIDYARAAAAPAVFELDERVVRVIGLEALLENKRAAGRPQDLVDVAQLELLGTQVRPSR